MTNTIRLACMLPFAAASGCTDRSNHPAQAVAEAATSQSPYDSVIKPLAVYPVPRDTGTNDVDPNREYFDFQVEKQAVPLPTNVPPRFPRVHPPGMWGSVSVQFIVDTTGHVVPGSMEILGPPNAHLDAPVRDAVPAMRFQPATIHRCRVKELLEMTFTVPSSS